MLLSRAVTPRAFRVLLFLGLVLRAAGLPLRGTDDFNVWKLWTHAGSISVTTMYGVGGTPPERAVLKWGNRAGTVEYPPATLYALAAVGYAYRAYDPYYADGAALNAAVKLTVLLGDIGVCAALWLLMRRFTEDGARLAVLAYWLNPAAILDGAYLGYLDPWLGALTAAAVLAIERRRFALCGATLALTALTKLQIVLVGPMFLVLFLQRAHGAVRWKAATSALAAAAVTTAVIVAPFALIGALPNLMQGSGRAFHHDMLSAENTNVWWLATWALRGWESPVRILGISRAIELGYPNPRIVGTILGGGAMLWAFWRARLASLPLVLASGALAMHAYTLLSVQVHENHFYLALPLMAAAAPLLRRLRGPYALASAVCFLNMWLFQGLGQDLRPPPRLIGRLDPTVVLAFVNVAAFAWHARRFNAACASHQSASPGAVDRDRDAADVRRSG